MNYFGIDLGQTNDYTALACVEVIGNGKRVLRKLNQWRKMRYIQMLTECSKIVKRYGGIVYGDATGAASPGCFERFEVMIQPNDFRYIKITGGDRAYLNQQTHLFHLPKALMIAELQMMIENEQLAVPSTITLWEKLKEQIANYECKLSPAGNEIYSARDPDVHDDLIIAIGLACYASSHDNTVESIKSVRQRMTSDVDKVLPVSKKMTRDLL